MSKNSLPRGRAEKGNHVVEIVIGLVIVAVAAGAFFAIKGFPSGGGSSAGESQNLFAVVQSSSGIREVFSLGDEATFEAQTEAGTNLVEVKEGAVKVREASCPNQVCVQTGTVSHVGDTIVCLPHQLVVEVVAHPDDASPVKGLLN